MCFGGMLLAQHALDNGGQGQDFAHVYEEGSGLTWAVCCDGHGEPDASFCLNDWLSSLDWPEFFRACSDSPERCPGERLEELLKPHIGETLSEGACILMCRLRQQEVHFWSRGDVVGRLYTGNDLLVSTRPHSAYALDRIFSPADLKVDWQVKAVGDGRITMVPASRLNLNPHYDRTGKSSHALARVEDNCAVYNCLGHNGWAKGKWEHLKVPLGRLSEVSVVIGSDGLWDMLSEREISELPKLGHSAAALVKLAAERWVQLWEYVWEGKTVDACQKIDSRDDVSCVILKVRS